MQKMPIPFIPDYKMIIMIAIMLAALGTRSAVADVSALIYHRFGEKSLPSTNITLDQFEEHIALINQGNYDLLSVDQLAQKLADGSALPDKGLVVTVDDAYRSFKDEAWPRLKAANIPVTLFVATDAVSGAGVDSAYLTWDEIRDLQKQGVTIGHHGASHSHLPRIGLKQAIADIEKASRVFRQELGFVPTLFAYPYGEYTLKLKNWLENNGFTLAFAQYSSGINKDSDRFEVPRFPLNERYGDKNRFSLVSSAKALPAKDILPRDPVISSQMDNPPLLGFTLTEDVKGIEQLTCYPSHTGQPAKVERLMSGKGQMRIEIRFDQPVPAGRSRINCTMPAADGRWYWLGRPFFIFDALSEE